MQIPATHLCPRWTDQIGLFEIEYLVPYFLHKTSWDQDIRLKNAVTLKLGFRSLRVIENDNFWWTECQHLLTFYCNYCNVLCNYVKCNCLGCFWITVTVTVQKHNFAISPLFSGLSVFPSYLLYGKTRMMGLAECFCDWFSHLHTLIPV